MMTNPNPQALPAGSEISDPNCRQSDDGEHEGYWINKAAGNFRCYHCGFQFFLREMIQPTPEDRIEVWRL